MNKYVIEDGIEPPKGRGERNKSELRKTLESMECGQSIHVPVGKSENVKSRSSVNQTCFLTFGAGNYATQGDDFGVRVWRIK